MFKTVHPRMPTESISNASELRLGLRVCVRVPVTNRPLSFTPDTVQLSVSRLLQSSCSSETKALNIHHLRYTQRARPLDSTYTITSHRREDFFRMTDQL